MVKRGWRCRRISDQRRIAFSAALLGLVGLALAYQVFSIHGCRIPEGGVARIVRTAALNWDRSAHAGICPTYADLVRSRFLEPLNNGVVDASVRVRCEPSGIIVHWAGPDNEFSTLDDETAPDPLGKPRQLTFSRLWPVLPLASAATLLFAILTIIASKLRSPNTAILARLASVLGWLVLAACVGSGIADSGLVHAFAPNRALAPADALRLRTREIDALIHQTTFGGLVAAPGMMLGSLGARRRRRPIHCNRSVCPRH